VKISSRLLPAALIAAVMAAVAYAPASAGAERQVAFGMFTPGAPENRSVIDQFSQKIGRRPVIWHTYRNWDQDPFPTDIVGTAHEAGAVALITWEPFDRDLRGIASGRYDSYVRSSARQAKSWGKPILLRFAHEMNGDWYPWGAGANSPAEYKAAWRHVVRVFRNEGANNVRWVWAPNTGSFDSLFPGDEWIDFTGLDGYNWGAKYNSWESFEDVFDSSYKAITRLSRKPLLITEFGANSAGGNKAAWIRHAFSRAVAERYPRIRALIWFDRAQDGADWRVDDTPGTLEAFRSAINGSLFDLDVAGLLGADNPGGGNPPPVTPPKPDDRSGATSAAAKVRCGVRARRSLRMSGDWTIQVPLRCGPSIPARCFAIVKVRHAGSGRTLGRAEVELWPGRGTPVRIGLPGWARTSLVDRRVVRARVAMKVTDGGCRRGPARRVTLRR
jgi:endoglucanase